MAPAQFPPAARFALDQRRSVPGRGRRGPPHERPSRYEAAVNLYGGELLPEDRYEDWAVRRREEMRALQAELLVRLSRLREQCGEHEAAIEALRQYQHLCEELRRELDAEPGAVRSTGPAGALSQRWKSYVGVG